MMHVFLNMMVMYWLTEKVLRSNPHRPMCVICIGNKLVCHLGLWAYILVLFHLFKLLQCCLIIINIIINSQYDYNVLNL